MNSTMQYAKPGDVLDVETPVIVSVTDKTVRVVTTRCSRMPTT